MTVERLRRVHAHEYRALMLKAYETYPDAYTSTAAERAALPLTWWEARLCDDPAASEVVFGTFRNGVLGGAACLLFETREKARHKVSLVGMFVDPEFRRVGVGREIVESALSYAKSRSGVLVVQLTVTEGNKAAEVLYQKCGFVRFGLEPLAVLLEQRFAAKVHMWCDLRDDVT